MNVDPGDAQYERRVRDAVRTDQGEERDRQDTREREECGGGADLLDGSQVRRRLVTRRQGDRYEQESGQRRRRFGRDREQLA